MLPTVVHGLLMCCGRDLDRWLLVRCGCLGRRLGGALGVFGEGEVDGGLEIHGHVLID